MKVTVQDVATALHIARQNAEKRLSNSPFELQAARGGRRKVYRDEDLPADIRAALAVHFSSAQTRTSPPPAAAPGDGAAAGGFSSAEEAALAANFDAQPESAKARARTALERVQHYFSLVVTCGLTPSAARKNTARKYAVSSLTIDRDAKKTLGKPEHLWLYLLARNNHRGRTATAELSAEAWEILKADYLRPERPSASACITRLIERAAGKGWVIPSKRTLLRRLEQLPRAVKLLARNGAKALSEAYPAQQRSRAALTALSIVNADGYKHNLWVRFPDGEIVRAKTWYWQDVYSSKILAWRADKTEHTDVIRLSFGDLCERWGIPEAALIDNTLAAANKTMSGGVKHRFRFKVREEEPDGVFKLLGVRIMWATPGHGQAKPVERAFGVGGVGEYIDKAPELAGAWTGANPLEKPDYHGKGKVIALADLQAVITREIAAWNARAGRRGINTHGRSHDEVFDESYRAIPVRRATEEQLRLWLLATEPVRVARDGTITLDAGRIVGEKLSNRYWSQDLFELAGRMVAARFDPQRLHEGVHVYTADGRYIGFADCDRPAGFNDQLAARERARARNTFVRNAKAMRAAEQRMDVLEAARALAGTDAPVIPAPAAPERTVIRPEFRHPLERPRYVPRERSPEERAELEQIEALAPAPVPIELMGDRERYALWKTLRARRAAGDQLDERMAAFYAGYAETGEIYLATERELGVREECG